MEGCTSPRSYDKGYVAARCNPELIDDAIVKPKKRSLQVYRFCLF